MNTESMVKIINERIKNQWEKNKKDLLPEINFEAFRNCCLGHLDIASDVEIQNYKIGYAAVQDKLDNIKLQEKIDENKELKRDIERLNFENKVLKRNEPRIIL